MDYAGVRSRTEKICEGLELEDLVIQPLPFASPAKWHLGHTTWFFETFCLEKFFEEKPFDAGFRGVFNSYYESIGPRIAQDRRGTLSRPTLSRVLQYRKAVDERMKSALSRIAHETDARKKTWAETLELGLHHEMQHQELLYMDLKAALFHQPEYPSLPSGSEIEARFEQIARNPEMGWVEIEEGIREIGATDEGFAFDLERPRHREFLHTARVMQGWVTNEDYLEFIESGAYTRPEFWLSAGWAWVRANQIEAPLYWVRSGNAWQEFILDGLEALDPKRPVSHVSYYEADAFARWKGKRLPTEAEWEIALADSANLPLLWGWTGSAYLPYPGFKPLSGALGEYNGKFMSGQMVLRGGCAATPPGERRPSSRNFFSPEMRWQFSGIKLAE